MNQSRNCVCTVCGFIRVAWLWTQRAFCLLCIMAGVLRSEYQLSVHVPAGRVGRQCLNSQELPSACCNYPFCNIKQVGQRAIVVFRLCKHFLRLFDDCLLVEFSYTSILVALSSRWHCDCASCSLSAVISICTTQVMGYSGVICGTVAGNY